MPLPPPVARQHLHSRDIEIRGYRRDDGLWDVEAHLTDVKSYAFPNQWRGLIEPGTPLHDMWIRLTVDSRLTVVDIEVATDASPFRICPEVAPAFQAVKGLTIGPGWNRRLREAVGGRQGCTHLVELLGAMATVAIQTQVRDREERQAARREAARAERRPAVLDSCYALASDSEVTARLWPQFYTGGGDEKPKE